MAIHFNIKIDETVKRLTSEASETSNLLNGLLVEIRDKIFNSLLSSSHKIDFSNQKSILVKRLFFKDLSKLDAYEANKIPSVDRLIKKELSDLHSLLKQVKDSAKRIEKKKLLDDLILKMSSLLKEEEQLSKQIYFELFKWNEDSKKIFESLSDLINPNLSNEDMQEAKELIEAEIMKENSFLSSAILLNSKLHDAISLVGDSLVSAVSFKVLSIAFEHSVVRDRLVIFDSSFLRLIQSRLKNSVLEINNSPFKKNVIWIPDIVLAESISGKNMHNSTLISKRNFNILVEHLKLSNKVILGGSLGNVDRDDVSRMLRFWTNKGEPWEKFLGGADFRIINYLQKLALTGDKRKFVIIAYDVDFENYEKKNAIGNARYFNVFEHIKVA